MKILILSDIHANLSALTAVLKDAEQYNIEHVVLLGDHIDYGMRPNETLSAIKSMQFQVLCNLWGNHEKAIMDGDLSRFSSRRGQAFSSYTQGLLTAQSKEYILKNMDQDGYCVFGAGRFQCLAVHASLEDIFWKAVTVSSISDAYKAYDYVFFGHSHIPVYYEHYFDDPSSLLRGRKKTVFINPGSVGQPRNHNPNASYAVLDTADGRMHLNNVRYDIAAEQALYQNTAADEFYMTRLSLGI